MQRSLRQPVFVLFRAFMDMFSLPVSPKFAPSFDDRDSFFILALLLLFPDAGAMGFSNTIVPLPGIDI